MTVVLITKTDRVHLLIDLRLTASGPMSLISGHPLKYAKQPDLELSRDEKKLVPSKPAQLMFGMKK